MTARVAARVAQFGRDYGALLAIAVVGLGVRVAAWPYATTDTGNYLLPWYAYAKAHGWSSLGHAFTNYAPLYTYFLILAAKLDGLLPPLLLIKGISYAFELATALLCRRFVHRLTGSNAKALWAFAAAWLAPSVLYNGALWGQADSVWAFFSLLSAYLFAFNRRGGVFALALAICSKAQGVFAGPFALGAALKQRRSLLAFLWIPALYVLIALPVLIAGRSLNSVLLVYVDQANTFHSLSRNAGSLWALIPYVPYFAGTIVGLAVTAAAGLALAITIERSARADAAFMLLAACASLLMTPYLMPKMHERYFYAFEIASIVLACSQPRYALIAVVAQLDAVFTYLAFDRQTPLAVPFAAAQNGLLLFYLIDQLRKPVSPSRAPTQLELAIYGAVALASLGTLWAVWLSPSNHVVLALCLAALSATVVLLGLILLRMMRVNSPAEAARAGGGD